MKYLTEEWVLFVVGLIGSLVVFIFILPKILDSKPDAPKVYTEKDREWTAYVCAKFKVEEELKAPSTAKFQPSPDAVITNNGSYYFVKSYVDAQNSFGAMIRTNFICKILDPNPEISDCEAITCAYQ